MRCSPSAAGGTDAWSPCAPGAKPPVLRTTRFSRPACTDVRVPFPVTATLRRSTPDGVNAWPCALPPASRRAHGCSTISTRASPIDSYTLEDAVADGHGQRLDRPGDVILLADDAVDEVLDRFARDHGVEPSFEAQRDRQVARIVAIATRQHAQHAQPRLAVAARLDRHATASARPGPASSSRSAG